MADSEKVSVIITAHNEGEEVKRTIDSIRANTEEPYEIILMDDASTDGSTSNDLGARVIRHETRIGIAASRCEGVDAATGDVFAFLDAHQRVSPLCLNHCADVARNHDAIVWPDVRGLKDRFKCSGCGKSWVDNEPDDKRQQAECPKCGSVGYLKWNGHGALACQKQNKKEGYFDGRWINRKPRDPISRCYTMIVPGYVIPRSVWHKVRPADGLRGWGASEAAISVKAFFADVDILHVCGPLARHYFRPGRKIPYECPWHQVTLNHAITARVCFTDKTWQGYWRAVFGRWLKDDLKRLDKDPLFVTQHDDFASIKQRPDREFWLGLMKTELPKGVA